MRELKKLMDDVSSEIKEYWFDFSDTTGRKQGTQIRINFNYLFSKFVMYDQQVGEWREQLKEDINDYGNIRNFLAQMQEPYGFLDFKAEREKGFGMTFEGIDQEQ